MVSQNHLGNGSNTREALEQQCYLALLVNMKSLNNK